MASGPGAEEALALAGNNWITAGGVSHHWPLALSLSHVFESAERQQTLQLRTLLVRELHRSLFPLAFPSGAEPALAPDVEAAGNHLKAWSEITVVGDLAAPGARPMTLDELAAAPAHLRAAIRKARAQQLLSAVAACVEAHWFGGLKALAPTACLLMNEASAAALAALVRAAEALRSALFLAPAGPAGANASETQQEAQGQPALPCLSPRVQLERISTTGDDPTAPLTPARAGAQIQRAEALESQGRFLEAAELYKESIASDIRQPELRLVRSPPMVWQYLGAQGAGWVCAAVSLMVAVAGGGE